jgi:hypothetical protein
VPDIEVAMVCGGGEEHVSHLDVIGPGAHRRDDAALGTFGIAHLHKPAKPELERGQVRRSGPQRTDNKSR